MSFCSATPEVVTNDVQRSVDKDSPPNVLRRPNQSRLWRTSSFAEEKATSVVDQASGAGETLSECREWAVAGDGMGNDDGLMDEDWLLDEDWLEATLALVDGAQAM